MVGYFSTIKKLRESKFDDPILSVYLSTAEKKSPHPIFLSTQLHSLVYNLDKAELKKFNKDIEKMDNYLHQTYRPGGIHSLAFFSSGEKLWEVLDFQFFLPPLCIVLHRPYLKPIEEALNTYKKYMVLLVDREKAKFFTVHLDKIEDSYEVSNGQVPQKVKAIKVDYGREPQINRHIEDHLHRHLQMVAKTALDFFKNKNIHFIIIGSHKELIPKIRKTLPYPLNKLVLGEFITELNIPVNLILRHSRKY